MEDSPGGRVFDKIVYSVFSGIDWGSQQFTASCPRRERWSWNKFWNSINKFEKNKDEFEKQAENREMLQHSPPFKEERDMEISIDQNEFSRHGYRNCAIKMQDPCAPCCCTIECVEPPTCTDVPPIDRAPRCECEKRQTIKIGSKCCDTTAFEVA